MSTYVVSKQTIDVIVYGLNKFDFVFDYDHHRYTSPLVAAEKNSIGSLLWNLNREAAGDTWKDDIYDYHVPEQSHRNLSTLYGCLDCYGYQIADLHTFHAEQIREVIRKMKSDIVMFLLKEHDGNVEVPWGI